MTRELLFVLCLVLAVVIVGLVASVVAFVKEHGLFTLIWRHLSGMPLTGDHLNDAGWLTPASDRRAHTPTGRTSTFYTRPRLHRAARRVARYALLAVLGLIWTHYPTSWAAVYSSEVALPFVVLAVVVGRIRWIERKHHRTWVKPLHLAAAAMVGLPAAADPRGWLAIEPDRSKVVATLPQGFAPKEHDGDHLVGTIIAKLGLESPDVKWQLAGPKPRLVLTASNPPPSAVSLDDVRDALDRIKGHELIWGPGKNNTLITTSLTLDSPHLGLSMGSGAGKSRTARWLLAQMLYRGALCIVLDVKMVSQHWAAWSGALPNVIIARSAAEIHAILIWLAVELERRNGVALKHADAEGNVPPNLAHLIGPRLVVCAEELNATAKVLRQHWTRIRTKDDPTRSPALDALDSLSLMGRQAMMNVIYIGQRLSVRATGGDGDARENIGVIAFGRYSPSNWKMLAPDFQMPPKSLTPGRLQVVSDKVQEVQCPNVTALEARHLATAGTLAAFPPDAPGARVIAGSVLAIDSREHGPVICDSPVSPVLAPGVVTLAEAVKLEVVGCSLSALRQARHRGQLPDPLPDLRGMAQQWNAEELRLWDLARR